MEIDIIIFKDGLYHLWPYKYNFNFSILSVFEYCDALREAYTTYYENKNQHIINKGAFKGYQWFGCIG